MPSADDSTMWSFLISRTEASSCVNAVPSARRWDSLTIPCDFRWASLAATNAWRCPASAARVIHAWNASSSTGVPCPLSKARAVRYMAST